MALLYGRARRLTAENGGFWPGQFGRRRILNICFAYQCLSNGVLFLGQTSVMSHLPWLWIYYSLNQGATDRGFRGLT
jgi:hypothetical protein